MKLVGETGRARLRISWIEEAQTTATALAGESSVVGQAEFSLRLFLPKPPFPFPTKINF